MSQSVTVSVIIPVYNGASYIREALQSVLDQSFKDFEIIVVDDGSTDDTPKVLTPWIEKKHLRYIHQPNQGLAAARNTGIAQARGKYLKFLDCDDVLYPRQLELQVADLENEKPEVISATGYDLQFESKNKIQVDLQLKEDQLAHFIEGNPCPVHTVLVHKDLVEQYGCFDHQLRSHEDSNLWLRILLKGGRFKKNNYIGCCYRLVKGALSDNKAQMFENHCLFAEKLNKALLPILPTLTYEARYQLYYHNVHMIHQAFSQNQKTSACLPHTLKSTLELRLMKNKGFKGLTLCLVGIEEFLRRQYAGICRNDPKYPSKLFNTAWRDERFYSRKDSRYLEVLPTEHKIKNVLYINSSAVMYGAETRLLDIVRHLDKQKFRAFALLPAPGPLKDRLEELDVQTMQIDYRFIVRLRRKHSAIIEFFKANQEFVRLAKKHKIDIIHANLHIHVSNFWLAFLLLGKPVIIHMRSHFWLDIFEKFMICRTSKAICISKHVENDFLKKRRSSPLMMHWPGHTEILHDGIDTNHFSPQKTEGMIRRELKIRDDEFMVGMIGAVDKIKGQDLLIEAARLVTAKHPKIKFVIVGDLYHPGKSNLEYRDLLLRKIKEYQLENHVLFTGFRSDINVFMNEIDLLVQPSEREALGTSMVEAMACGKPVIGTKVDGIPEVIGDNESGLLLDPRTPEAFAKAINFFIENPQERIRLGRQGRERALRLFNIYRNIKRIETIYHQTSDQW